MIPAAQDAEHSRCGLACCHMTDSGLASGVPGTGTAKAAGASGSAPSAVPCRGQRGQPLPNDAGWRALSRSRDGLHSQVILATLLVMALAPAQGHGHAGKMRWQETTPGLHQQAASGNMDIFKLLQSNSLIYACLCLRDHHQPPDTGWDSAASLL